MPDPLPEMDVSVDPSADNSVVINAALADPIIQVVILPPGDIRVDHAIIVPSGKWLRGAGMGVTRLIRTDNIATSDYSDKTVIVSASAATGVHVSDLTVVSPKVNDKVQGVWMLGATGFLVERVSAYNCGYAFWAHELASDGVFRDIQSFNANVHFETTQASAITFDGLRWGDGDGDNPLGVEAVHHCLYESKNITFKNSRGSGSGQPFLVVANDGGLIDTIRFVRCDAVNTDGRIPILLSRLNGTGIGNVLMDDCNISATGVTCQVQVGNLTIRGGSSLTTSAESFQVYPGATLHVIDHDTTMNAAGGTNGNIYEVDVGGQDGGTIRVDGGSITANQPVINLSQGKDVTFANAPRVIGPGRLIFKPTAKGQVIRYVYPADVALAQDYQPVGTGTPYPVATFGINAFGTYRVRFRGLVKKTGSSAGQFYLFLDTSGGVSLTTTYGRTRFLDHDGQPYTGLPNASVTNSGALNNVQGDVRMFDMDLTFQGTYTGVPIVMGGGYGAGNLATLLGGAELLIERLS